MALNDLGMCNWEGIRVVVARCKWRGAKPGLVWWFSFAVVEGEQWTGEWFWRGLTRSNLVNNIKGGLVLGLGFGPGKIEKWVGFVCCLDLAFGVVLF